MVNVDVAKISRAARPQLSTSHLDGHLIEALESESARTV
jgi:hypothetical protein